MKMIDLPTAPADFDQYPPSFRAFAARDDVHVQFLDVVRRGISVAVCGVKIRGRSSDGRDFFTIMSFDDDLVRETAGNAIEKNVIAQRDYIAARPDLIK